LYGYRRRKQSTTRGWRWLSKCCTYAICLRTWGSCRSPTHLCEREDNTACIEWGNHVIGGRERAKHIDIRKHFARETIQNRKMRLVKVDTSNQLADILTGFSRAALGYCLGRVEKSFLLEGPATQEGARSRHHRGCGDGCCGHRTPRDEPRFVFRGVFASKESTRPKWS
jgi:hypothetical protein